MPGSWIASSSTDQVPRRIVESYSEISGRRWYEIVIDRLSLSRVKLVHVHSVRTIQQTTVTTQGNPSGGRKRGPSIVPAVRVTLIDILERILPSDCTA